MACSLKTTDITLEASNIFFGKEHAVCVEPVTGLVGGEYFKISDQTTKYVFYFTVNSVGADPALVGYTSQEIALPTAYTVAAAVDAIITAMATLKKFYTIESNDGLSVILETIGVGAVLEAVTDQDTGFTFEVLKTGIETKLGRTTDGVEVTFEATTLDVTTNETGTLVLDQIIQGTSASASMALVEVSKERVESIIGGGFGDVYTPVAGTKLVGFGTSKNFKSAFNYAGRLILNPIRLGTADRTEDVTFWKTLPLPESINYSGTDAKALSVSFTALVDDTKPAAISVFAIGDSSQYLA